MKKTLYILRHGETDYNRKGLVQGCGIDADLNETGQLQGDAFCEYYADVAFEKVYTSQLRRTWQTVSKFLEQGIGSEKLQGLNEMSYGVYEGKSIHDKEEYFLKNVRKFWDSGSYDAKAPNGQSPNELMAQQKEAMQHILQNKAENPVLIAMHGRALRVMLCWMLGRELKDMETFPMPNTCLYILEYNYETQNYTCVKEASTHHLLGVEVVTV